MMNSEQKRFKVFKSLVNKMLKRHNVDYDYVVANPVIEEKDWFIYYTWSEEEEQQFHDEAVEYVRKTLKETKRHAQNIVGMFLLTYGLKTSQSTE